MSILTRMIPTGILLAILQTMVPLWVAPPLVGAHPQCLDFRPPFGLDTPNTFCGNYSDFGCCTKKRDGELLAQYNFIYAQLGSMGLQSRCSSYLRDLLCLECNPYAAHIFDAEATMVKRPLPGMCTNYCHDFYTQCRRIVSKLTSDRRVINSLASSNYFCDTNKLPDMNYCFPDVLSNFRLNKEITRERRTEEGCLCLEEFARNLRNPLIFCYPNDGSGRIFVTEQIGVVHIFYRNGTRLSEPFMDIQNMVLTTGWQGDERGFLGMTFPPDFQKTKKFYVYYSTRIGWQHYTRLSEFRVSKIDENKADNQSERVLIAIKQPYANHNGGQVLFGTDGYLYLFTGDGGAGGDPQNNAQNRKTLLGKALRIDINGNSSTLPYRIPPSNPYATSSTYQKEIYAYGIRNIWRCDVDEGHPITGDGKGRIICGDVGQGRYEEIDLIKKGKNYGWNIKEGFSCYHSHRDCGRLDTEPPIHAYGRSEGQSVTGGHVYRGCQNPNLQGHYIYGDYGSGAIFRLKENKKTGKWENKRLFMCQKDVCFNGLVGSYERNILSFGEDQDGEIYVLTTDSPSPKSNRGRIYKIVDPRRRGDPSTCRTYVSSTATSTSTTTTQATTTTTKATTTTTVTTTKAKFTGADIVFLLDSSGSIGRRNWPAILGFVKNVSKRLGRFGSSGYRFSVIEFGNDAHLNISLTKYSSYHTFSNAVDEIPFKDQWTNTASAFRLMRIHLRSAGTNAPRVGILVTDGPSNRNADRTIPEMLQSHRENIYVFVVGIERYTGALKMEELNAAIENEGMTYNVNSKELIIIKRFGQLEKAGLEIIKGIRTIAGDDGLAVTGAPTTTTTTTTTQAPRGTFQWACSFETIDNRGDWCSMTQDPRNDQFDWTLQKGRTPSLETGPESAHRGKYYIYIEASSPRRFNDTAIILFPRFNRQGAHCLEFYRHMYGYHIGLLQVLIRRSGKYYVVFTRRGRQRVCWQLERVSLDLQYGDQVAFLGLRAKAFSGDISIDTVSVRAGSCS